MGTSFLPLLARYFAWGYSQSFNYFHKFIGRETPQQCSDALGSKEACCFGEGPEKRTFRIISSNSDFCFRMSSRAAQPFAAVVHNTIRNYLKNLSACQSEAANAIALAVKGMVTNGSAVEYLCRCKIARHVWQSWYGCQGITDWHCKLRGNYGVVTDRITKQLIRAVVL
jgi:hypothetical protein